MRYWVQMGGKPRGPFSIEQLAADRVPDASLVCPEDAQRDRREDWVTLGSVRRPNKAKVARRFHVRIGARVCGPYAAAELEKVGGFNGDTLVCPEKRNYRNRWNWAPAHTFPALRAFEVKAAPGRAAPAPSGPGREGPGDTAPAPNAPWRFQLRFHKPRLLPTAASAGITILSVLLWMRISYIPRVRESFMRLQTSMDLVALAQLQERYHRQTGTYADSLAPLLKVSFDPKLPEVLARDLDPETLLIQGTSAHFVLEANSVDRNRTLIHFEASASDKAP
jgi:hypothetical protein